jgi:ATP-dependent Lon protease
LAWTHSAVSFVFQCHHARQRRIQRHGKAGDVMKESAKAAISYVDPSENFNIDQKFLKI